VSALGGGVHDQQGLALTQHRRMAFPRDAYTNLTAVP